MAEDIMCIRNKYASDYKKKEVLITIFHLNGFIKRDINGMKKKAQLISGKYDVLVCSLFCEFTLL